MTVTAQAGTFSWGGQSAKESVATTWYRHRVVDGDITEITDDRMGPPEVGGRPTPTIPYRAGYLVSGGLSINPRLVDVFGWLLFGALGAVTTTANSPESGLHSHKFAFASNESWIPWMSFRKHVVGAAVDGSEDIGMIYEDCRVIGATFNLPASGIVNARFDVLGREFAFDESPDAWTYANTMEGHESVPISSVVGGYFKIPGYSATELPIIGAQVSLGNVPLDIRQEMVYGSPQLDNVTPVLRTLGAQVTLKWQDPDLWQSIFTGSASGTAWTSTPFIHDMDVLASSPADVDDTYSNPFTLRIQSDEMMWRPVGGIRLAGNNAVLITLQGTAFENDAGDYCAVTLQNSTASYTWPT